MAIIKKKDIDQNYKPGGIYVFGNEEQIIDQSPRQKKLQEIKDATYNYVSLPTPLPGKDAIFLLDYIEKLEKALEFIHGCTLTPLVEQTLKDILK